MTHDLVIRNGFVIDGSGSPGREGDVAIDDGKITAVGKVAGKGREEIDAKGEIVTPGFVDVHTHYDGQVTWGDALTPSSIHGVTTAIMGTRPVILMLWFMASGFSLRNALRREPGQSRRKQWASAGLVTVGVGAMAF